MRILEFNESILEEYTGILIQFNENILEFTLNKNILKFFQI